MPCDPIFLANIRMLELFDEDDRRALAKLVDEYHFAEKQGAEYLGSLGS
jgi:hypothetical protein